MYGEPRRRTAVPFTEELRQAVRAALEEMRQDGRLSELAVKYFGADLSKSD